MLQAQAGKFERRILPYFNRILQYEEPHRQQAAREIVPGENLREKALLALAKEGNLKPSNTELDNAFLLQLLFWFKQTFKWVNSPPCEDCDNETSYQGMGVANPSEIAYGASLVELHSCNVCSRITRFPRYNDPLKLLETNKGRCGEWANCFSFCCRSFGYETRLILDFTDHVWTECYSMLLGRWMHLDPCEGVYDNPLLYENGWGKKLNYTIGIARDGVYDVTKRYTMKWHEVLSRRTLTTESDVSNILANLTRERRMSFTPSDTSALEERDRTEVEQLHTELPN